MGQSILLTEHLLCALSADLHAAHVQEAKRILKELTVCGGYTEALIKQVPLATGKEQRKSLGSEVSFPEKLQSPSAFKREKSMKGMLVPFTLCFLSRRRSLSCVPCKKKKKKIKIMIIH